MALATSSSSSVNQAGNQSLQSATSSDFGASQTSGGVQPGTATALLSSNNGIKLSNTALSTVDLNSASSKTTASVVAAPKSTTSQHKVNVPLLCFAGLLIVIAAFLFWTTSRSVKSTT